MDTERRVWEKGKANKLIEGRNKEIRRQRMDLSSAGHKRFVVDGRGLRPSEDLRQLMSW